MKPTGHFKSFAALAILLCVECAHAAAPLRALFLGDTGHHQPNARFQQLQPALSSRGIDITYTDRLEDLNAAKLAGYDALIIFANHTRISRR